MKKIVYIFTFFSLISSCIVASDRDPNEESKTSTVPTVQRPDTLGIESIKPNFSTQETVKNNSSTQETVKNNSSTQETAKNNCSKGATS